LTSGIGAGRGAGRGAARGAGRGAGRGTPRARGRSIALGSSQLRQILAAALLLPFAGVLFLGFQHAFDPNPPIQTPCWILSNGYVIQSPFNPTCPMKGSDRVLRVGPQGEMKGVVNPSRIRDAGSTRKNSLNLEVNRAGNTFHVELPINSPTRGARALRASLATLLTGCLIVLPLILLHRSRARAAVPLAIFYSAIATVTATALSAQQSEIANLIATLGLILAPAALYHLALVFPRERAVAVAVPGVQLLPYGIGALFLPVGLLAHGSDPILWPLFSHVAVAATLGAWTLLILSCTYALQEASSSEEYARARLMLLGTFLFPLLPTIGFATVASSFLEVATFYLWALPISLPIPIGLAISRYNLFDLEMNIRFLVARMVFLGLSALTLSVIFVGILSLAGAPENLRTFTVVALSSVIGITALEALRSRIPQLVENTLAPAIQSFRQLRCRLEEDLSTLQGADAISQRVSEDLQSGLTGCSGSVLVQHGEIWRPAHLFGKNPPWGTNLVQEAVLALGCSPLVHLPAATGRDFDMAALAEAEVEVIAAIRGGGALLGLLLVTSPGCSKPYSWVELDFISTTSTLTGVALHNARLSEELVAAEEKAALGRFALGVAHDVGKELGWIHRLARQLPSRMDDSQRFVRDTQLLVDLTKDTLDGLRRFVDESARHASDEDPDSSRAEQALSGIIARAVRQVEIEHTPRKVSVVVDPATSAVLCHPSFGRALFNLLDNAAHASPKDQTVRLFATRVGADQIRIEIEDRGPGIALHETERVFEPGFTTRAQSGGSGIGLTIARDILSGLGGGIQLGPGQPCGTLATIVFPIHSELGMRS
jgi:signal transduction histidine kinase